MPENQIPISNTGDSAPKPTTQGSQAEFKRVLLSQIRPSRNNPRKIFRQEMIDARAASMAEEGQINAIIIRPLTPAELLNDGVIFEIVDGELRYRAALKNGDKDIDAKIEDISPLKAFKTGVSANRNNKMEWFEEYIDMEYLDKNDPDIKRQEIAALFEVDNATVTRAMKIMDALNEASRALVFENFKKSTGSWRIAENTLLKLAELGDPQTVVKALKVAIDGKMTTQKATNLVTWVQAGNPPETFGSDPKTPKAKKAPGISPEALAKALELAEQIGVAKGRGEDPKPYQDRLDAHLAEIKTAPPVVPSPSFKVTSPEGRALLRQAWQEMKALISPHSGISSPSTKTSNEGSGTQQTQKEIKPIVHWFEKAAHWVIKIVWHIIAKTEHHLARKLAHALVPSHLSSRSGQTHSSGTHSGHSHHRSGSLSQGFGTLVLTILHWAVYVIIQFMVLWSLAMWFTSHWFTGLKPWIGMPFRFTARLALVEFPNWAWPLALSYWPIAIAIAVVLFMGWSYLWNTQKARMTMLSLCFLLFFYYGRKWADQPGPLSQPVVSANQIVSATPAVIEPVRSASPAGISSHSGTQEPASNSSLRTSNSTPVAAYQPSVSFAPPASPAQTLYDPKLLEQEIAALPKNCIVKSFPVLTDENMPGDLAVSRLQDLTDPDKYTMKIGSGKQLIQSITTTTTNLIINYKSTDPFNMFNGPGQLNYFWEDVLYIHTDEIDTGASVRSSELGSSSPSSGISTPTGFQQSQTKTSNSGNVFYQLSLVVSGSKYALTIQCASVDDLKHLVSTMQYFIRNSRLSPSGGGLGHDTALAGMPFPSQGLVLNNACVVDKLWADSPMDKASVALGDHFWSIGKVTSERQSRNDLEAGLQSLPITLFVASPAEWEKALTAARVPGQSIGFRPKLRKVVLTEP